jgi:hypothetical protein
MSWTCLLHPSSGYPEAGGISRRQSPTTLKAVIQGRDMMGRWINMCMPISQIKDFTG